MAEERVLAGLQPERVLYYFEEISRIPRPSYHEKAISDYLVAFAGAHGLTCTQDELYNCVIIKEASPGREAEPAIILQGHMDMVCEQEADCDKNMLTEGLDLYVDGDWIKARGTTLGGDDGIAVAYALALLEDKTLSHPRLEFVCTVSEETGMEGAHGVDLSALRGRVLLNLDNEGEGMVLASCAGGGRLSVELPVQRKAADGATRVAIRVSGLVGGHSGAEIDKGRANADMLAARVLRAILQETPARLVSFAGGTKDNAICREANLVVAVAPEKLAVLRQAVETAASGIASEYAAADPDIAIEVTVPDVAASDGDVAVSDGGAAASDRGAAVSDGNAADGARTRPVSEAAVGSTDPVTEEDTRAIVALMLSLPNGVIRMSDHIEGLVETSLNLGILELKDAVFSMSYALRSSVGDAYAALRENMRFVAESRGARVTARAEYPAWEYKEKSPLREALQEKYKAMFDKELRVEAIHAGVECGIIADKLPGLDAVSMGPDILDIHTPAERMSIASVERTYTFLRAVIEAGV